MTLLLRHLTVKNFLGFKDISINFHTDVNFLIGKNGTGKTTLIRIINHALSLEIAELRSFDFDELAIEFFDAVSGHAPELRIKRFDDRRFIGVEFRRSRREKFQRYVSKPSKRLIRTTEYQELSLPFITEHADETAPFAQLIGIFREELRFSWLPLLRYGATRVSSPFDDAEDETFDRNDPINNKIEDLASRSARYLSVLDYRSAQETKAFQKNYFLALLADSTDYNFDAKPKFLSMIPSQKIVMSNIFSELGFEADEFRPYIERHFERLSSAISNYSDKTRGIDLDELITIANNKRLQDVIERFQSYEKKKVEIYQPKTDFVEIVNKLFYNKVFDFSESNEPTINIVNSSKPITPYELSSGERQIFVILSETLLQEQQAHIFLADEPELSLHIEWQEILVRNIRALNNQCQLVFATHSPDLVNVYQDRVIDFDRL